MNTEPQLMRMLPLYSSALCEGLYPVAHGMERLGGVALSEWEI